MTKEQTKKIWQPKNIPDIFFTNGEKYKNKNALTYKKGHRYHKLTYGELRDEIVRTALALRKIGVKKGDYVLIVSENRPEWVMVDVALMVIGAISVPIPKNISSSQVTCILKETRPSTVFFSDEMALETVLSGDSELDKIKHFISFDGVIDQNFKIVAFDVLIEEVKHPDKLFAKGKKIISEIKLDDVATVVYTSGTTGKPKGAKLTHRNFIFVAMRAVELLNFNEEDLFLSVLPLSHIFERLAGSFMPLYAAASIEYCTNIVNFSSDIKRVCPTVILAVPRLFEKIYDQVWAKVSGKIITKLIFNLAMKQNRDSGILSKLFYDLVFKKIQEGLGGCLRVCVAGGAAINPDIISFFNKIGITLVEGYGLTETTSALSANGMKDNKISTVGRPFRGLDVKIADDGEVLVKGDSVMAGYLNQKDNINAFTDDMFFKTGDIGSLDEDGYLSIVGRKKDIQVLTTGEKVVPAVIENILTSLSYIDQALVIGDGRKHIAAILVINDASVRSRLSISDDVNLANSPEVTDFLTDQVTRATNNLPRIQQIEKFIITTEPFSLDNEQATVSMKPRRQAILDYYADEINELYA